MLNAFFATVRKVYFSFTGTLGSYFGTGSSATSNQITAVGNTTVTITGSPGTTGGNAAYRINAGSYVSLTPDTPTDVALTNGQLINVRMSLMNSAGDGGISIYEGARFLDNYPVSKIS